MQSTEKTSSVHFMCFELSDEMLVKAKSGANISMGIDHPYYTVKLDAIDERVRQSFVGDLY